MIAGLDLTENEMELAYAHFSYSGDINKNIYQVPQTHQQLLSMAKYLTSVDQHIISLLEGLAINSGWISNWAFISRKSPCRCGYDVICFVNYSRQAGQRFLKYLKYLNYFRIFSVLEMFWKWYIFFKTLLQCLGNVVKFCRIHDKF